MELLVLPLALLGFLAAEIASPPQVDDSDFYLTCESTLQTLATHPQYIAYDPYTPWRKRYPGVVAACEGAEAVTEVAPNGIIPNSKEMPWKS